MLPASPPPPTELVPAPYSPASLLNRIFQEDCLQGMQRIPDKSIDMILCDLPYGTTQGEWDPVIPFEALWLQYGRVIKPHGAIVLTAVQPFTSLLSTSNLKLLKYSWVWAKSEDTGHQNSRNALCVPMKMCWFFLWEHLGITHRKRKEPRTTRARLCDRLRFTAIRRQRP